MSPLKWRWQRDQGKYDISPLRAFMNHYELKRIPSLVLLIVQFAVDDVVDGVEQVFGFFHLVEGGFAL
jgi:hypothetical protein